MFKTTTLVDRLRLTIPPDSHEAFDHVHRVVQLIRMTVVPTGDVIRDLVDAYALALWILSHQARSLITPMQGGNEEVLEVASFASQRLRSGGNLHFAHELRDELVKAGELPSGCDMHLRPAM
jgi:hypothetical protein